MILQKNLNNKAGHKLKNDPFLELQLLLHPCLLICFSCMAFNDHYFKYHGPDWLTGKLSDFLGLFLAPIYILVFLRFIGAFVGEAFARLQIGWMFLVYFLTGVLFTLIQVSVEMSDSYAYILTWLGFPSVNTPDPWDLVALVSLPVSFYFLFYQWVREDLLYKKP